MSKKRLNNKTLTLGLVFSGFMFASCTHNGDFDNGFNRSIASGRSVANYSQKSVRDIFEIDRPFSVGEYWVDHYFVATDDLTWAEVSRMLYDSNKNQKILQSINFSQSPVVGDIIYYFKDDGVSKNKTFSHIPYSQLKTEYVARQENNEIRMPAMEMTLKTQADVDAEEAQELFEKKKLENSLFEDSNRKPVHSKPSSGDGDMFDDRKLDTSEHLCTKHWLLSKVFGKKSKATKVISRFLASHAGEYKHRSSRLEK